MVSGWLLRFPSTNRIPMLYRLCEADAHCLTSFDLSRLASSWLASYSFGHCLHWKPVSFPLFHRVNAKDIHFDLAIRLTDYVPYVIDPRPKCASTCRLVENKQHNFQSKVIEQLGATISNTLDIRPSRCLKHLLNLTGLEIHKVITVAGIITVPVRHYH